MHYSIGLVIITLKISIPQPHFSYALSFHLCQVFLCMASRIVSKLLLIPRGLSWCLCLLAFLRYIFDGRRHLSL